MKKLIFIMALLLYVVCSNAQAPISRTVLRGTTYLQSDTLKSINGSTVSVDGNRITDVADPINAGDAVNLQTLQNSLETVGGDTLFTTIALSDETSDLETGPAVRTFRMPVACTITGVRASVTTAPAGANLNIDINEGGISIFSTVLSIDSGENTSTTAASVAVISNSTIADNAEITIDIDQVGSTVPGSGAKVIIYYIKN